MLALLSLCQERDKIQREAWDQTPLGPEAQGTCFPQGGEALGWSEGWFLLGFLLQFLQSKPDW
jgi:hypothetical protein